MPPPRPRAAARKIVQLKLNKSWTNPSGEWKLGVKRGFELFPGKLKKRLTADAKKEWDKTHHAAEAAATEAVAVWAKAHPEATPTPDAMKEKQELDERVAQLSALKFDFTGPVYDVVVWNDGKVWRAAVDGAETGDLTGASHFVGMTDYHKERQWAKLGPTIQLNYCVNFYQDGDVCNICVDCGEHGTHVAGIVGAHRPDAPELNGLAPGCQIVALKIGDARMGSMETLPGLVRALAEVVSHKCDLINMSYGEATSVPNQGFFFDMAREVVNKHNVIFVSSAGNAGPALTTASSPRGCPTPHAPSCGTPVPSTGGVVLWCRTRAPRGVGAAKPSRSTRGSFNAPET